MTTSEFKKIARLLKEAYSALEQECIDNGIDLLSDKYDDLQIKVREKILSNNGFTIQEYREAKAKIAGFSQIDLVEETEKIDEKVYDKVFSKINKVIEKMDYLEQKLGEFDIPTREEIASIARVISETYVTPPQITNQIVKETIVEKPQTIIKQEKYDDSELRNLISNSVKTKTYDDSGLKKYVENYFSENFKKNIDTLGMPNFRKLSMGLQEQIDRISSSSGVSGTINEIAYFDTATSIDSLPVATYPSLVELAYVKGVTSSIQTQLNTKGNVSKVGTPIDNQIGVWTGDGTIEGDSAFTFDTATDTLTIGAGAGIIVTHSFKSDASAGVLIEANNGTDVGLLGVGNTANVTWYGSHNFDTATQDTIAAFTGAGKTLGSLALATYPSLTELSYVKGVTSALQTQIDAKAPSTSPTFATSITGSYLTASEILITDASKKIVSAPVATYPSLTELTYVKGVTSAIQTQLGTKYQSGDSPSFGTITTTGNIELGNASDTTLSRSAAGVIAVEGVVIPSISSTNTLTNKRIEPRIVSATSYTTDTGTSLDVSTCDIFIVTAQAGALLFNAPGGTPVQGQRLVIRIKDNGTARALTWNAVFRAMGTALPSTTVLSKTLYLGFFYNSTDTKWDLVASAQEA